MAVYERVRTYNAEPFQKRQGSRLSVFDAQERPLLRPLSAVPFEISRWVYGRRVARNGHVVWEKNYYSVPFAHIGRSVDLRVTDTMIEVFAGNQRLTSHLLAAPGIPTRTAPTTLTYTMAPGTPSGTRCGSGNGPGEPVRTR